MEPSDRQELHGALKIDPVGIFYRQPDRLEQLNQLARRQVAPRPGRNTLDPERSKPNSPQAHDIDPDGLHHRPHDVIEPLMQHDLDDDSFGCLPQQPTLVRDHLAAGDDQPVLQSGDL